MLIKYQCLLTQYNYFEISIMQQKMLPRSIFTCCNGFDQGDQAQATNIASFKKMKTKLSKNNILCSSKASLRSLAHLKSTEKFRNLQNLDQNKYSRITENERMKETVRVLAPVQAFYRNSEQFYSPNHNKMTYLSPSSRFLTPFTSGSKEKIRFSYDQGNSAQNSNLFSGNVQRNRLNTVSGSQKKTLKMNLKEEPISLKLNNFQFPIKNRQQITNQNKSQVYEQKNPEEVSSSTGVKLGNSMFTIESEEEVQMIPDDKKQVRLQESAIIVDVFHPTKSQMDLWAVDKNSTKLQTTNSKRI